MNESAPPATRPFVSRLARYLPGAVIVYLVLCGLVALAVPLAIQYLALDRIGESIGRQVSIERTRFNPFKLTLAAQGVRVAGQDPADDFLTIEEVFADLSISSIWHLASITGVPWSICSGPRPEGSTSATSWIGWGQRRPSPIPRLGTSRRGSRCTTWS